MAVEGPFTFLRRGTRFGHNGSELCGKKIGKRRKDKRKKRQPPVIAHQHHDIYSHRNARIKDFSHKFAYAFDACIHIGNRLGQQLSRSFVRMVRRLLLQKRAVENRLHVPVHVIGKAAYIQTFPVPAQLHNENHHRIHDGQPNHEHCRPVSLQDIGQCLGKLSLKPGARSHADVVEDAGNRNVDEKFLLLADIEEQIRFRIFLLRFHFPCTIRAK